MPFTRKKDGEVIEQRGTKPPTAEALQKSKMKRIAEQNKSREEFEESRQPKPAESNKASAKAAVTTKPAAS